MAIGQHTLGVRLRAKIRLVIIVILGPLALTACAVSSGHRYDQLASAAPVQPDDNIMRGYGHLVMAGSSTVVAPGWAIGTKHGDSLDPGLIAKAPDQDLALIRIEGGRATPIAAPVVGEPVTAFGTGIAGETRYATGFVVKERTTMLLTMGGWNPTAKQSGMQTVPAVREIERGFIIEAPDVGPGFSGGPIYDQAGRLIGVTDSLYRDFATGKMYVFAFRADDAVAAFRAKMAACDAAPCASIAPSPLMRAAIIMAVILM